MYDVNMLFEKDENIYFKHLINNRYNFTKN